MKYDEWFNLGFIAQDVQDIIPESVRYDENNDVFLMEYSAMLYAKYINFRRHGCHEDNPCIRKPTTNNVCSRAKPGACRNNIVRETIHCLIGGYFRWSKITQGAYFKK